MINKDINSVFFLGVGGIGMSALARYMHAKEFRIAGYDKTPTSLTEEISLLGNVIYEDAVSELPVSFHNASTTLVVYTPAIPKDSSLLKYFDDNGFQVIKRSDLLGWLSTKYQTIAVGGTHGKTSTSALLAHLLEQRTEGVNAIIGGICANYRSNTLLSDDALELVTEADEFDRSFLKLHSKVAVMTSWDIDHLDIYQDKQDFIDSSLVFLSQAEQRYIAYSAIEENAKPNLAFLSYGISKEADVHPLHYEWKDNAWHFSLLFNGNEFQFESKFPGVYALENTLVAVHIALSLGVKVEKIQQGLLSYEGVLRRFQIKYKDDEKVLIEDYAHHPTEIKAFLNGITMAYPTMEKHLVFQAHLYSRTKDFEQDFIEVLKGFDGKVYLTPIYAARELPIAGVDTANWQTSIVQSAFGSMEQVAKSLEEQKGLFMVLGAGDIYKLSDQLVNKWNG